LEISIHSISIIASSKWPFFSSKFSITSSIKNISPERPQMM
jgi:hypothetical protein